MGQSVLQWSQTKPTAPGWYWYRESDVGPLPVMIDWTGFIEDPNCRQLDIEQPEDNIDLPMFEDATGEWAGPLSLPVESNSSDRGGTCEDIGCGHRLGCDLIRPCLVDKNRPVSLK